MVEKDKNDLADEAERKVRKLLLGKWTLIKTVADQLLGPDSPEIMEKPRVPRSL